MGQFLVFALFAFLHFGLILALFWHFLGFIGHLGILRVLVSYEVTRGTILVVGAVHNGFWGVGVVQGRFGRVWGGPEEVCFNPLGHFLLLWRSCTALDLVPKTTYWSNWLMFTG